MTPAKLMDAQLDWMIRRFPRWSRRALAYDNLAIHLSFILALSLPYLVTVWLLINLLTWFVHRA